MSNRETYDAARARITELVRGGDVDTPVDACPGWTVKDVVAHLAGGLGDFSAQRFDGVETGEWGQRQVRDRRTQSVEDALAEWSANIEAANALFDTPMGAVVLTEIISHEHDIRAALGRPGAREDVSVRAALTRPLQELDKRIRADGLPALRIEMEHGPRMLGDGEPAATLTASSFEVLRAIGGRRTPAEIRAMNWDADPSPWAAVMPLFGNGRTTPLGE